MTSVYKRFHFPLGGRLVVLQSNPNISQTGCDYDAKNAESDTAAASKAVTTTTASASASVSAATMTGTSSGCVPTPCRWQNNSSRKKNLMSTTVLSTIISVILSIALVCNLETNWMIIAQVAPSSATAAAQRQQDWVNELDHKNVRFPVTVVTKTYKNHGSFAHGDSLGYAIEARQGASLIAQPDKTYEFDVSEVDCSVPFLLWSQDVTPTAQDIADVLQQTDSTSASIRAAIKHTDAQYCGNGTSRTLVWQPTVEDIGKSFFYVSTNSAHMGGRIRVFKQSFCNKYASKFRLTDYEFIGRVCDRTFAILAESGPDMIGFFTGHRGPVDYFSDPRELMALRSRLVSWFGNQFGCDDDGFPSYLGPSMWEVHAKLDIGIREFHGFCDALLQAMTDSGVEQEDVDLKRRYLYGFFSSKPFGICNSYDCRTSICDRISDSMVMYHPSDKHPNTKFLHSLVDRFAENFHQLIHTGTIQVDASTSADAVLEQLTDKTSESRTTLQEYLGRHEMLSCTDEDRMRHRKSVMPEDIQLPLRSLQLRVTDITLPVLSNALTDALRDTGATQEELRLVRQLLREYPLVSTQQQTLNQIQGDVQAAAIVCGSDGTVGIVSDAAADMAALHATLSSHDNENESAIQRELAIRPNTTVQLSVHFSCIHQGPQHWYLMQQDPASADKCAQELLQSGVASHDAAMRIPVILPRAYGHSTANECSGSMCNRQDVGLEEQQGTEESESAPCAHAATSMAGLVSAENASEARHMFLLFVTPDVVEKASSATLVLRDRDCSVAIPVIMDQD
jgi:hypothetical protein